MAKLKTQTFKSKSAALKNAKGLEKKGDISKKDFTRVNKQLKPKKESYTTEMAERKKGEEY